MLAEKPAIYSGFATNIVFVMTLDFPLLEHPIVQAPMAGGPSTPALAAAVSNAGGLGFLAAGYLTTDQLKSDLEAVRATTTASFGVNLFALSPAPVDEAELEAFARSLEPDAARLGATLGRPRFEDDAFADKLELVAAAGVAIVSFAFGCPQAEVVHRLHEHGSAVWVTVTSVGEARLAVERGADALVVQGAEAGGHRGSFTDVDGAGDVSLLPLLRLIDREVKLPLVASGGIADGAGVAAALVAGARAVQIGTAFMCCPEAATHEAHRAALGTATGTALTRAFTGRRGRGLVNRFMQDHDPAPSAYPHIHHLTAPLRAAARAQGDAGSFNLWAGEAHALAQARPAAELVAQWSADARSAVQDAARRLGESRAAS
jgi:nitronate monooxygenase